MIVRIDYAEPAWHGSNRTASVTRQTKGWHLATFVNNEMDWQKPDLDRREAMQMARRWVETGEV